MSCKMELPADGSGCAPTGKCGHVPPETKDPACGRSFELALFPC